MKKNVVVQRKAGLEARPLVNIVQKASEYSSRIYVEQEGKCVNAKSITGMMSLVLMNGESVVLCAEGEDEQEAIEALEVFFIS